MPHTNNKEVELNPATKAMLEAIMWQIKGDMHNLVGQYHPAFTDKVERHMQKFLLALQQDAHQELQKAREEERERIEAIFKEHVPPHAMDLEDSVWLKRLLNKAFGHENIY